MSFIDFSIDQQDIDQWEQVAQTAPQTFQTFMSGTMKQHMQDEVNDRLAVTPPPVKLPIEWTSPKQRAYYFAVVAQRGDDGEILPYVRTGGFNKNWFVRVDLNNFAVGIGNSSMTDNDEPLYDFLVGDRQQKFHKNTGWIQADDPLLQIIIGTFDIIADAWQDIIAGGGQFA